MLSKTNMAARKKGADENPLKWVVSPYAANPERNSRSLRAFVSRSVLVLRKTKTL